MTALSKNDSLKKASALMAAASLFAGGLVFVPEVQAAEAPEIAAKAAFAIDNETNKVLIDQNGDEQFEIASMTKMLSMYLVLEAVEEGTVSWDQNVPVSDYVYRISQDYDLSNVPLRQDSTYTVRDLYEAALIYSANGAVIALAELIGGSEPDFVDMMKAQMDEWGISDYTLYNATGLPNSYAEDDIYPGAPVDAENKMSARGVATVADHLIEDFPDVLETTATVDKYFREGTEDAIYMHTYNLMLEGQTYYREGVDGLKTGTTDVSGYSFTGTTEENDMRITTVVIGASSHDDRFTETGRMMDYVYANYEKVDLAAEGDAVANLDPVTVDQGKEEEVGLQYTQDVSLVVEKGTEEPAYTAETELSGEAVNEDGNIEAPIEEGTAVGNVALTQEGDELGYLDGSEGLEVGVAVDSTVEKANILVRGWRAVADLAVSGWNAVADFAGGIFN